MGGLPCAKARLCGVRLRDSAQRIVGLVDEVEKQGGCFSAKDIAVIDEAEELCLKVENWMAEKAGAVVPES